jgi:hypothetical protein
MQMQTLSVRVPADDVAWLATLDLQGAVSPSDKLRTLIAQMRRQSEGGMDYAASVAWLRDLLTPLVTRIHAVENRHRMHSEALSLTAEWLPAIMATLLSARGIDVNDRARAVELEDLLVERCFQMLTSLLRLAVTREAACYDPGILDRHLPAVIEISAIVAQTRRVQREGK